MDEFQRPASKLSIGMTVLEEDEYLQKLEKIIQRDFFPELKTLEELRNGKPLDLDHTIEGLSLNDYLQQFTSDENQTFHEIIQRENYRWRDKHNWMFEVEQQHKDKILSIEQESNKLINMIDGSKINKLQLCDFTTLNQMYFPVEYSKQNPTADSNQNTKQVMIENTRLEEHDKPFGFAVEQINRELKDRMKEKLQEKLNQQGIELNLFSSTPNLMGYYDSSKQLERVEKYGHIDLGEVMGVKQQLQLQQEKQKPRIVGGYQMLAMPSPAPNQLKTPLMTWGELGETPLRIDRSYKIPNTPQRDQLASNLATQICNKKKSTIRLQQQNLKKKLQGITPHRQDSCGISRIESMVKSTGKSSNLRSIIKQEVIKQSPLDKRSRKIQKN